MKCFVHDVDGHKMVVHIYIVVMPNSFSAEVSNLDWIKGGTL
jgi:hypothetical protein